MFQLRLKNTFELAMVIKINFRFDIIACVSSWLSDGILCKPLSTELKEKNCELLELKECGGVNM